MAQHTTTVSLTSIHITGDTAGPKPVGDSLLIKIIGGRVATGDLLKFYVDYTEPNASPTHLSWDYTVAAGDDFQTAGVTFNLSPIFIISGDAVWSNGEVFNMSI